MHLNGNKIILNKLKVTQKFFSSKQKKEIFLDLAFPAHVAAYNGDFEHVKLLIEQGVVSVNERDERGATLAHKAAGQGHLQILQWLIEMGAALDLTTQSGETAKDVARRFSQLACLKILGGGADKSEMNQHRHESTKQGDRRKLTPKEEERRRARTKLDELEKQVDIAKKNYRQLGGHLDEDQQREIIEQDTQKYFFDEFDLFLDIQKFLLGKLKNMKLN
jgi:ankyrin repeat domain-containing protein 42